MVKLKKKIKAKILEVSRPILIEDQGQGHQFRTHPRPLCD